MPDRPLIAATNEGLRAAEDGSDYIIGFDDANMQDATLGDAGAPKMIFFDENSIDTPRKPLKCDLALLRKLTGGYDPLDYSISYDPTVFAAIIDDTAPSDHELATLFDMTGFFEDGTPFGITQNGGTTWHTLRETTATRLKFHGPAISTGSGHITALYPILHPLAIQTIPIFISGNYGESLQDLLANKMKTYFPWRSFRYARIIDIAATHATAAATTQPKINVKVDGVAVSLNDSSKGIQLGAAGAIIENPNYLIHSSANQVMPGDLIEIVCTEVGAPANGAKDLTVYLTLLFI